MKKNDSEPSKNMRMSGSKSTLAVCVVLSMLAAALVYMMESSSDSPMIHVLSAIFIAPAILCVYEAARRFSIRVELGETGFIYHVIPKGSRAYSYSDCISWEYVTEGIRYGSAGRRLVRLNMKNGDSIIVDNVMIKEGLGLRIGYYDSLPEAKHE